MSEMWKGNIFLFELFDPFLPFLTLFRYYGVYVGLGIMLDPTSSVAGSLRPYVLAPSYF